jgi:large subunit ribosomal protein L23
MNNVLIKPIITEKMTAGQEKLGRYGFVVAGNANKVEIKKAVESMYGVTVETVNTMNYIGKLKMRMTRTGIQVGVAKRHKKAVVTLKQGDSIDFYSSI